MVFYGMFYRVLMESLVANWLSTEPELVMKITMPVK